MQYSQMTPWSFFQMNFIACLNSGPRWIHGLVVCRLLCSNKILNGYSISRVEPSVDFRCRDSLCITRQFCIMVVFNQYFDELFKEVCQIFRSQSLFIIWLSASKGLTQWDCWDSWKMFQNSFMKRCTAISCWMPTLTGEFTEQQVSKEQLVGTRHNKLILHSGQWQWLGQCWWWLGCPWLPTLGPTDLVARVGTLLTHP